MAIARHVPSVESPTYQRKVSMNPQALTIRVANPDDVPALRRLAGLDSAPPLSGRVLLAELDGAPLAAVAVATGATIADPFQHSADAVRLLSLRRYQLLRQGGDVAPARSLLRRLIPSPAR
jgi:hypothetical protein